MNSEAVRALLNEHARSPLNGELPPGAQFTGKLVNPVCGDSVELHLLADGETLTSVGFRAQGCAICSASASLLRKALTGRTFTAALECSLQFEAALLSPQEAAWPALLCDLICFEHLRVNHSRRMCALLPWVVLRKTLRRS